MSDQVVKIGWLMVVQSLVSDGSNSVIDSLMNGLSVEFFEGRGDMMTAFY